MELNKIYNTDCLGPEGMVLIPDKSIDMILCDLPYGTTQNKWDSVISLPSLWEQYDRVIKDNGAIVLTAQTPFDKVLGVSNLKLLKYEWIWEKPQGTGFLNANKYPLKNHENILVFCKSLHLYNPQFGFGKPYSYNHDNTPSSRTTYGDFNSPKRESDGKRFPKTVIKFNNKAERVIHPTQKPVTLFEYLIKTYTNPGHTVLDNCIGSGTTAIACMNTDRNFIGFEKDPNYFLKAQARIQAHRLTPKALTFEF
jgi:site-specific DNA-methyltransferase (adenine-specific)